MAWSWKENKHSKFKCHICTEALVGKWIFFFFFFYVCKSYLICSLSSVYYLRTGGFFFFLFLSSLIFSSICEKAWKRKQLCRRKETIEELWKIVLATFFPTSSLVINKREYNLDQTKKIPYLPLRASVLLFKSGPLRKKTSSWIGMQKKK